MIKNYSKYLNEDVLALPPHIPETNDSKMIYTLMSLYKIEHKDINLTSNRINSILESGTYLRLRDKKYDITYIYQNEPILIFAVESSKSFSIWKYKNVKCVNDSLIVCCKSDNSMFVIDSSDFENYELIFIRPKKIISSHDPYGEEDWGEN